MEICIYDAWYEYEYVPHSQHGIVYIYYNSVTSWIIGRYPQHLDMNPIVEVITTRRAGNNA